MFCIKCGTVIPDDAKFCFKCGNEIKVTSDESNVSKETYQTNSETVQEVSSNPTILPTDHNNRSNNTSNTYDNKSSPNGCLILIIVVIVSFLIVWAIVYCSVNRPFSKIFNAPSDDTDVPATTTATNSISITTTTDNNTGVSQSSSIDNCQGDWKLTKLRTSLGQDLYLADIKLSNKSAYILSVSISGNTVKVNQAKDEGYGFYLLSFSAQAVVTGTGFSVTDDVSKEGWNFYDLGNNTIICSNKYDRYTSFYLEKGNIDANTLFDNIFSDSSFGGRNQPALPTGFEWVELPHLSNDGQKLEGVIRNNTGRSVDCYLTFSTYDKNGRQVDNAYDLIFSFHNGNEWKFSAYFPNEAKSFEFNELQVK